MWWRRWCKTPSAQSTECRPGTETLPQTRWTTSWALKLQQRLLSCLQERERETRGSARPWWRREAPEWASILWSAAVLGVLTLSRQATKSGNRNYWSVLLRLCRLTLHTEYQPDSCSVFDLSVCRMQYYLGHQLALVKSHKENRQSSDHLLREAHVENRQPRRY